MPIVAVDFDGTITDESSYPNVGILRPEAKKYLILLSKKNYKLILNTARKGIYFNQAVELIKEWQLPVDIPKIIEGKLVADFYIDDRAIPGKLKWKKIYRYIIRKIKN